ncbi:hypothetical protein [Pseudoxanthomonas sp. GM95]|uniref:hypothetical protein n=1 Tax=Pseudoxanthomonas sp. GM95 TaxID=1881043 RepID=UPI00158732D3|nr:hypothetical protein [Pseudoxanthomonas sp. GM95]
MAVAVVLLVVACTVFGLLMVKPRNASRSDITESNPALEASLADWSSDLKTLAISLHLGRWNDVRYAMQWDVLEVPDSVFVALDEQSLGDKQTVLLSRVMQEATTLAKTSVLIEHHYLLPSGQVPKKGTQRYSATDYARAVRMLCISIDRAVAALEPQNRSVSNYGARSEPSAQPLSEAA